MTCPAFTWSLKSACSSDTVPDTCVPTCTVVTACTLPVALMVLARFPRRTFTTAYVGAAGFDNAFHDAAPAPARPAQASVHTSHFRHRFAGLGSALGSDPTGANSSSVRSSLTLLSVMVPMILLLLPASQRPQSWYH